MKLKLICAIFKNIGRLLSYDFWRLAFTDPGFPAWFFVRAFLLAAVVDMLLMVFIPNYPAEQD